MKFISWNINGLRAALKRGFVDTVQKMQPDVLCLQETKASPEQVDLDLKEYHASWNSADKKGYSGTLTLSRVQPLQVFSGMGIPEHDTEGRVLTAEFDDYFLVNVYTPNAKRDLSRLDYRVQWDRDFLAFLKKLEQKKPVVFCGDLNVAHTEIDLANPKANEGNHGFTKEEREGFSNFLKAGFIDTFREFHKEGGHYTWWTLRNNARERNIGWRIDYFLISSSLRPRLKDAFILKDVMGSDHCPVGIVLE